MPTEDEQALAELRADLTDGEDLILAARLIGDALSRRMRRARSLLDALAAHPAASDDRGRHVADLRRRADEVEKELERVADRFRHVMGEFESELRDLAGTLDDEG